MKADEIGEIGAKMDALGIWDLILRCNWAICPKGTVIPYFCTSVREQNEAVKARLMLLEGWQTFHDYIRSRVDPSFGFYSVPMEMPHYGMVVLKDGGIEIYRYDPCYAPRPANERQREFCARILWQVYGVMLRLEADPSLPLRFAESKAMFARVETAEGEWRDAPLPIPDPRTHVENISLEKAAVSRAKDLPMPEDLAVELDLRIVPGRISREARPRCMYLYGAVDAASGELLFHKRMSVDPEEGLRGLWEGLAQRVLNSFLELGRVPREIRVRSDRVFRMIRPLGMQLPFKLTKCAEFVRYEDAVRKILV